MHFRKTQSVRLVIADDHPIFRDGLRRLLEAEADLKVIGEASDGAEAVKLAKQLKPDILLLDLAGSAWSGAEGFRHAVASEGDSHGHGGRILGGTRERLKPGAISPDAHAVVP